MELPKDRGLMQVAVDAAVFTVKEGKLSILLIKRKYAPFQGMFALPGGFVNREEDFEDAARRELEEETGVRDIFLLKIGAYGAPGRDPRGRIVSIAFLALISPNQDLRAATDAAKAQWFAIDGLPALAFDHKAIVEDVLRELRYQIQTTNIAFQILPKQFTLTQFQSLYEHVLGMPLDKRNFRKRVKELGILKPTQRMLQDGAHRPARLYMFASGKYQNIRDRISVIV